MGTYTNGAYAYLNWHREQSAQLQHDIGYGGLVTEDLFLYDNELDTRDNESDFREWARKTDSSDEQS
jgi:hypothetical protein